MTADAQASRVDCQILHGTRIMGHDYEFEGENRSLVKRDSRYLDFCFRHLDGNARYDMVDDAERNWEWGYLSLFMLK
ncbi:MAG: hypothetical protein Q9213_005222 [Squamulea squamosa]